jgi:hypothetical protein
MLNVPGHPSPAGVASSRLACNLCWILVSSLGNVRFAHLIKELGTSRQLRTHLLVENLFENSS